MEASYRRSSLWQTAFPDSASDHVAQRKRIIEAHERFRERVALLLQQIQKELPNLTLHDITHVDALWEVASEIAGPDYPLNPAEALVLGGAFLLHDAAHCRAAYPGGLDELKKLDEWRDAAARRGLAPEGLLPGSDEFQGVLFDTLRALHPKQAKELVFAKWKDSDGTEASLFPDDELRNAYGDLIGQIAESHWFHPHQLESFGKTVRAAPTCLAPANWTIDPLKLAILLRVADACHLDARRAPRFLMLLNRPEGVSAIHWQFQSKLHQIHCDKEREELRITGSPFKISQQAAWWQAYDAACLADKELSASDALLRDFRGQRLAAKEIAGSRSPESFARFVATDGWYPIDSSLRISNIQSVVERFGGEKLYGDKPWLALRELIQNARDAIHAARSLGYLNNNEGEIEVCVEDTDGGHWLHITDNGIGMSRYVLTEVLLDFGHSLWRSDEIKSEWSGLASSDFEAVGQFGIGFFSVFMLSDQVRVCTKRCEAKDDENDNGWLLEFNSGTRSRPLLRAPNKSEKLKKSGTCVSVFLTPEKKEKLGIKESVPWGKDGILTIDQTVAHLSPAIDIDIVIKEQGSRKIAVKANDWKKLPTLELMRRLYPFSYADDNMKRHHSWLKLTDAKDKTNEVIGRCAVIEKYRSKSALGVTKGIFAGYIDGITGIIQSAPQKDLSRQSAIPKIEKLDLQRWAEQQKNELLNNGGLNLALSAALAEYGASTHNLIVGTLGGNPVTQKQLQDYLLNTKEFVIHQGEVTYEGDDDVRESEFKSFSAEEYLFESNHSYLRSSSWTEEIISGEPESMLWSIKTGYISALIYAWGNQDNWDEDTETVIVGHVDGTEILRSCSIFNRIENDE